MIEIKGKEYIVRELTADDVESLSAILDKIDFDIMDFEKQARSMTKGGKLVLNQKIATEIMLQLFAQISAKLIRNYHKAHKEMRKFCASLIGATEEEFGKMPITAPAMIIKELAKDGELVNFIKSVQQ